MCVLLTPKNEKKKKFYQSKIENFFFLPPIIIQMMFIFVFSSIRHYMMYHIDVKKKRTESLSIKMLRMNNLCRIYIFFLDIKNIY